MKTLKVILYMLAMACAVIAVMPKAHADIRWSSCAAINAGMASQNMRDDTGSISQAYDCENGEVTVLAEINPHIIPKAVLAATDSFINNYCLTMSKNYLLANTTERELFKVMLRGGVKYVVRHEAIQDQVRTKSLEECLKYVQIMENQLPENPYEQTKFIYQFTTEAKGY